MQTRGLTNNEAMISSYNSNALSELIFKEQIEKDLEKKNQMILIELEEN